MSRLHSVCNQPPMFTQDTYYSSWRKDFEAYISSNDPDMWIPLVERYERPVIEGTNTEKSYISMTTTERKACENERKALTAIQSALSMEVLKLFKHHKNAYDLWVAIEKRCGGYQMEEEHQNSVLVAQVKEVDSDSLKCLSCIHLTGSNSMYRDDIENLRSNLENLTQANKVLKSNERLFENKLKAVQTDTSSFKAKIFSQQDAIDSYLKEITLLKRELAESQAELTDLKRKYGNWTSSSIIFDDLLKVQRMLKRKTGIGFNQCPPPTDFCPLPVKDAIKDFVPSSSKEDTNSVNAPVNEQVKKAELVRPTFVKAENKPPVSVEEVVEVEDILEESTIKVEKLNVKPENFIITTENDERFKCKGKNMVDNKSKSLDNSQSPVKNLKKNKLVEKYEINKCTTSTSSTSGTSTSTCAPKSACSTNVPANRPSVYCPPPKRFEGTHWNRSYVERRSCFRCGQQGHIIRDCKLLSLDRFGRGMPRTSSFRNSFSKSFSRRGSYSPVSSCASNYPKPTVRVNKVVPIRPQVQRHNIVENKSSEPKQVWRPKSTNDTSMKSSEFLKYHKLIDVMVMDDSGQPKSIKAWVSHKL